MNACNGSNEIKHCRLCLGTINLLNFSSVDQVLADNKAKEILCVTDIKVCYSKYLLLFYLIKFGFRST